MASHKRFESDPSHAIVAVLTPTEASRDIKLVTIGLTWARGCDISEFRGDKILNKDTYWKLVGRRDRL